MVFLKCKFFRASFYTLSKTLIACRDMQLRFFKVKTLLNDAFKTYSWQVLDECDDLLSDVVRHGPTKPPVFAARSLHWRLLSATKQNVQKNEKLMNKCGILWVFGNDFPRFVKIFLAKKDKYGKSTKICIHSVSTQYRKTSSRGAFIIRTWSFLKCFWRISTWFHKISDSTMTLSII